MHILNPSLYGDASTLLIKELNKQIVGQDEAKYALVNVVEKHQAGLADPTRPAGSILFLGPTGTGKTHTIEAMCKGLFGDERACIKIDCAEYQHGHEISKIVGSPPGYLGHRETSPMISQEALAKYHTDAIKLSVLLFDEIEKSSDTLWNLLLGILDKATLTLGDNRRVNFKDVIVVMTSNLGSVDMSKLTTGGLGFMTEELLAAVLDSRIDEIVKMAAKRKFTPEFFNRIDEVAVFKTLTKKEIEHVLSIELGNLQSRLMTAGKTTFFVHVRKSARQVLLAEGYNRTYGARHLKRTIEQRVLNPLSRLLASGQIKELDVIMVTEVGRPEFEFSTMEEQPVNASAIQNGN